MLFQRTAEKEEWYQTWIEVCKLREKKHFVRFLNFILIDTQTRHTSLTYVGTTWLPLHKPTPSDTPSPTFGLFSCVEGEARLKASGSLVVVKEMRLFSAQF